MSQYKMLCLDIDGTLLNSRHQITEKTKIAIRKIIKEKNVVVILASARMPQGVFFLAKELDICAPVICYNGALVLDNNQNVLLSSRITASDIPAIYAIVGDYGMHMSLYKDDAWYIEKMDKWAEQEEAITNITPIIHNFPALFTCWEAQKNGCHKILCMGGHEKMSAITTALRAKYQNSLHGYFSKPTYLEIVPKSASKTTAIQLLLQKYNIARENLVAIGDSHNDIDMITYAGLGIAMGNASEEVKAYAKAVTLSNDEDGVAYAINKYI